MRLVDEGLLQSWSGLGTVPLFKLLALRFQILSEQGVISIAHKIFPRYLRLG